jgi:hypothetical protein
VAVGNRAPEVPKYARIEPLRGVTDTVNKDSGDRGQARRIWPMKLSYGNVGAPWAPYVSSGTLAGLEAPVTE